MPCHEPGEELDTGVRGRPDYTIDWYLCKQKAGAEVYRGACSTIDRMYTNISTYICIIFYIN